MNMIGKEVRAQSWAPNLSNLCTVAPKYPSTVLCLPRVGEDFGHDNVYNVFFLGKGRVDIGCLTLFVSCLWVRVTTEPVYSCSPTIV